MTMNCTKTGKDIELLVLGGLDGPRALKVEEHLKRCPACRQIEQEYRLLLAELKGQARLDISAASLPRRVCEEIEPHLARARAGVQFRRLAFAAASVAAAVLVACAWYAQVGDRSGRATAAAGKSVAASRPSATLWEKANAATTGIYDADGILARNGLVFFLADDGGKNVVNAVDAVSGESVWHSDLSSCGYLAADEQRVYCVASKGASGAALAALDNQSGKTLWTFDKIETPYAGHGYSGAVPLSDSDICWVCENSVYVLDARTGDEIWCRTFDDEGRMSRAVIVGNRIYLAGRNGIYCVDGVTGDMRSHLRYRFYTRPGMKPLIAATESNRLFVAAGSKDGRSWVRRIDIASGRCLWEKLVPRVTHLHADSTRVYLRCQDVLALDQNNGDHVWDIEAAGCSPITACGNVICFVDRNRRGRLVAVARDSGNMAWQIPGLHSCNAFIKAGDKGYLKTDDSIVLAFAFGS